MQITTQIGVLRKKEKAESKEIWAKEKERKKEKRKEESKKHKREERSIQTEERKKKKKKKKCRHLFFLCGLGIELGLTCLPKFTIMPHYS